jgi:hypothetical protein
VVVVASHASDHPRSDPVIVVTNPGKDCSPEAFRHLLDQLETGPGPELESLGAAEVLRNAPRRRRRVKAVVIDASAGAEIVLGG